MKTGAVNLLELRNQRLRAREARRMAVLGGASGRSGIVKPAKSRNTVSDQAIPMPEPLTNGGQVVGSGQLLILSATGVSIASGGDYVTFDTIVAREGFADVHRGGRFLGPSVRLRCTCSIYEHAWDAFTVGRHGRAWSSTAPWLTTA